MEAQDTSLPYAGRPLDSLKRIAILVYALQAASFFVALTFIAGVVINYVKRDEVRGTWLESHFRWQIRTFWFAMLWGFLGAFTLGVGVGYLILLANAVWMIYRIVRGWLALGEGKALYV